MPAVWYASVVFWLVRVMWACVVGSSGHIVAVAWLISESCQAVVGLYNLLSVEKHDVSWRAWSVLVLYSASYAVVPVAVETWASVAAAACLMALLIVRGGVCLYMGKAYSSGSPNYIVLVQTGPFAYCRHPLGALTLLQRIVFFVGSPCYWNLGVLLYGFAVTYWVCKSEEKYLHQVCPLYAEYEKSVPFRFLPWGAK